MEFDYDFQPRFENIPIKKRLQLHFQLGKIDFEKLQFLWATKMVSEVTSLGWVQTYGNNIIY